MKVSPICIASTLSLLSPVSHGFSLSSVGNRKTAVSFVQLSASNQNLFFASEASTEDSEIKSEKTIYDKVGFAEDKIAIGVDAADILKYLGTRDDLIAKFESDNPKFDMERAALEVDRFMMDGEMVSKYIAFEKSKLEKPGMFREEAEATLSDPSTWATYAAWIIGGAGFGIVRNKIIEPKFASGEWEEIHIQLPNIFPVNDKAAEVAADLATQTPDVAAVSDVVQAAVDTVN